MIEHDVLWKCIELNIIKWSRKRSNLYPILLIQHCSSWLRFVWELNALVFTFVCMLLFFLWCYCLSYLIVLKIENVKWCVIAILRSAVVFVYEFCLFVCLVWSTKMEVVDHCSAFASTNLPHPNRNVVRLANHRSILLACIHFVPVMAKCPFGPSPMLVRMTSECDTPTFEED